MWARIGVSSRSSASTAAPTIASRDRRARHPWRCTAAEARAHATLTAVVLWTVAGVILFAGSGHRSIFGPLKGSDFVQFYTLGHLDERTAPTVLYDPEAFHRLQTELVPESAAERYLIVYPPHAPILFRPFAGLAYGTAVLLWAAMLALAYVGCVWLAWRPHRDVLRDRRLLIAVAAAYPPFWYLVLHGQTTIVPLLGFVLGWLALEHRRRFWAGAAFGLLLLKPQFALVLVPVVLIAREWAILSGAVVSIAAHLVAVAAVLGRSVLWDYAAVVTRLPQLRESLEPRPEQMHSLSAMTTQLPADWGVITWALVSVSIVVVTVQIWRSDAALSVRMGVLMLASTLVNPHLFAYDATVLAPALIWFAGWIYGAGTAPPWARFSFAPLLYALCLTVLFPTAAFLPVQLSVLVLLALFVLTVSAVAASTGAQPVIAAAVSDSRA